MAKRQVLTAEQAEEFTHNLGQITARDYGLMDMAINTLQVPAALGMAPEEWVQERLGGYVRWTVEQRRVAVRELSEDGKNNEQVAEILGISRDTVGRDLAVLSAAQAAPLALKVGESAAQAAPTPKLTPAERTPGFGRC